MELIVRNWIVNWIELVLLHQRMEEFGLVSLPSRLGFPRRLSCTSLCDSYSLYRKLCGQGLLLLQAYSA